MKLIIKPKNLIKFIGPIIFFIIVFNILDEKKLYSSISQINPIFLIIPIFIDIVFLITKACRWQYILHKLKISYPFKQTLKIYSLSLLIGMITPANIGELLGKISFLKKDGHQLNFSLVSIFIDRIADLIILLVITIFGIIFFAKIFGLNSLIIPLIILISIILGFVIIRFDLFKKIAKKIFLSIAPKKIQEKWQNYLSETLINIKKINYRKLAIIMLITFFSQIVNLIFLYSLAKILKIDQIPAIYLLFTSVIASFVSMIPITINGLGTREAAFLIMFYSFNIASEKTVIFSFLIFLISFLSVPIMIAYSLLNGKK